MERIKIKAIIGTGIAVLDKDGAPLFEFLVGKIQKADPVELDFTELSITSTAFLNYSIGQLYLKYDHSIVDQLITYSNVSPIQKDQLSRVINNAKNYPFYRKLIKEAKQLV